MEPAGAVKIILRRMALDDIEQVYAIDVASFSLPWSLRSYRYELTENSNSRGWVAEAVDARGDRQVVGVIVAWLILDEAHIATIATDPAWRRMGIARRLLRKALAAASLEGAVTAHLEVRRGNLSAQALYREFGFRVVGERPRYYKDTMEDALLMTLDPLQVMASDHHGGTEDTEKEI